jgi:hypothetical protein
MDWTATYIVYRIGSTGNLEEVYHSSELKQAKYWLTYIGLPGDVLCKTPVHPKHTKGTKKAEYWSHKAQSGTPSNEEKEWREFARRRNFTADFPEEQLTQPAA